MTHPLFSRFTSNDQTGSDIGKNFHTGWQSPSNIAFVKYWGKKNGQIPLNPSLSMTLATSVSKTFLHASCNEKEKGLVAVNSDPQHPFLPKMRSLLGKLSLEIPVLGTMTFRADTVNTFPHSTGIASSASGISAFALCLLDIACQMLNEEIAGPAWYQLASFASRIGSGSASRSVYGGFVVWGETTAISDSSDEYAIPVNENIHRELKTLRDAILIVSSEKKQMPSSMGHQAMNDHPFLAGRMVQARRNLEEILYALANNDFEKLCCIAENEALSLHALIMSAGDPVVLMQPGTLEIIRQVRRARDGGLPLFFTLDAGANVHLVYQAAQAGKVEKFILEALSPYCENGRVIFDACGAGPVRLDRSPEKFPL